MKPIRFRRRVAGLVAACFLLGACADPDVTVQAGDFGEEDTAAYLILSDQAQRVRNILKKPVSVCMGTFPNGPHHGIALVPDDVMDRLKEEQASADIRLEIASTYECLSYYMRDKGSFTPQRSDILVFTGLYDGPCGKWFGGLYDQGSLDRGVQYDVEVENGIAKLVGGRGCGRSLQWYRS